MRVANLDLVEFDANHASRILLETLGLSLTLESIGSRQRREACRLLTAMRRAARTGHLPGLFEVHHAYHHAKRGDRPDDGAILGGHPIVEPEPTWKERFHRSRVAFGFTYVKLAKVEWKDFRGINAAVRYAPQRIGE
jgi:hypothetical protein